MTELDSQYRALIDSGRVSSKTRAVLLARLERSQEPPLKGGLSSATVSILQAMAERIAPVSGRSIGFGEQINARLVNGKGKGWRYSELPSDLTAYRSAINTIRLFCLNKFNASFVDLRTEEQVHTLTLIQSGELVTECEASSKSDTLDAAQMRRWFEDLRGDITALYMSHPETLARLGYSGIADGEDSTALSGFVQLGLDKVEPWEPKARGTSE